MKEKYIRFLITILFVVFVQACSSNPPKLVNRESLITSPTGNTMQLLADEIGKTAVNEVYINNPTSASKKTEYRVTQNYTAASGRQCKEIAAVDASGDVLPTPAVVCRAKSGHWYWPRKIILK